MPSKWKEAYPSKQRGRLHKHTYDFNRMPTDGATCKAETGFTCGELTDLWKLCQQDLPDRKRGPPHSTACYFYCYFKWVNNMPTENNWKSTMKTELGGKISITAFKQNCIPIAECIAAYTRTYEWKTAYEPTNHHRLWTHYVTGIVDGFPVFISEPSDKETNRLMTAGKYQATCARGELVVDLRGNIMSFDWPHPGCRNDAPMRKSAHEKNPMHPQERLIGDGAYKASCQVLTGYIKPNKNKKKGTNPQLTSDQKKFNTKFNAARQRVSLSTFQICH